ncbi:hypothetical protein OHA25_56545 [Nonomuraea sp. NBC_00507]|uniref:hypothetical protein n=1 Tax=Nonomuraea sp. NBC_00507 TaxID=2976002 RepID=UPI002E172C81
MTDPEELAKFEHLRYKGPYIPYEERWRQFNQVLTVALAEAWREGRLRTEETDAERD